MEENLELFLHGVEAVSLTFESLIYAVVAFLVFPLWHRTHHRFLAWIGFGALFNLAHALYAQFFLLSPDSPISSLTIAVGYAFSSIGSISYGIAMVLLWRFLRQQTPAEITPS